MKTAQDFWEYCLCQEHLSRQMAYLGVQCPLFAEEMWRIAKILAMREVASAWQDRESAAAKEIASLREALERVRVATGILDI
jgi:hypothetical protein